MKSRTSSAASQFSDTSLYDEDFFAWTQRTAERLRARQLAEVDVDHAADEIAEMGKRDLTELGGRMRVLLTHLLKWELQKHKRIRSWQATIITQRQDIADLLEQSPSLRPKLSGLLTKGYARAAKLAALETGLDASRFPAKCPFTLRQVLDEEFLPG